MSQLIVANEIEITASPEKVWNALVNPAQTKKYMFGCEALSDWKLGSALLWEGEYQGTKMVVVKGKISGITPGTYLHYTVIDPNNAAIPDIEENYLHVEYFVTPSENGTLLKVVQSGFETVALGQARFEETYNNGIGWEPILTQIKAICKG